MTNPISSITAWLAKVLPHSGKAGKQPLSKAEHDALLIDKDKQKAITQAGKGDRWWVVDTAPKPAAAKTTQKYTEPFSSLTEKEQEQLVELVKEVYVAGMQKGEQKARATAKKATPTPKKVQVVPATAPAPQQPTKQAQTPQSPEQALNFAFEKYTEKDREKNRHPFAGAAERIRNKYKK